MTDLLTVTSAGELCKSLGQTGKEWVISPEGCTLSLAPDLGSWEGRESRMFGQCWARGLVTSGLPCLRPQESDGNQGPAGAASFPLPLGGQETEQPGIYQRWSGSPRCPWAG